MSISKRAAHFVGWSKPYPADRSQQGQRKRNSFLIEAFYRKHWYDVIEHSFISGIPVRFLTEKKIPEMLKFEINRCGIEEWLSRVNPTNGLFWRKKSEIRKRNQALNASFKNDLAIKRTKAKC